MNIESKLKEIEATYYWDAKAFDLQISYFGDEITLIYEDEGDKCWKATFLFCGKLEYDNDALWPKWRDDEQVREMIRPELGYFTQDFKIVPYADNDEFVECRVDLSIMTMKIICRDIKIEHCDLSDFHFFWQDNNDKTQ